MTMSVIVAMSGGVDSSVAAAVLVEQGYDVIGITMKMHDSPKASGSKAGCCTVEDADDARSVSARLGIPYYVVDLSEPFGEKVIDNFVSEYAAGRAPNPCVECNRHIKFTELAARADALDIDFIATGHHARLHNGSLFRALDSPKDQSYVLACLDPNLLSRVILPIGSMTKTQVREKADELGLRTAQKAESMGVCFLGQRDKSFFLEKRIELTPGKILDQSGEAIGQHSGAPIYTLGQRRGVSVAVGERVYVHDVNVADNTITVAPGLPMCTSFTAKNASWLTDMTDRLAAFEAGSDHESDPITLDVLVQVSAHAQARAAQLEMLPDGQVNVSYIDHAPAPAPGQLAAFYADDNVVLGAATIDSVEFV